jgi:MoxR-like ATPase
MSDSLYTAGAPGEPSPSKPRTIPVSWRASIKAEAYRPGKGLERAVNVALMLGQPLLVTGEPGTGKTRLAWHLAHRLGWGEPLVFEAKSTSTARDLFYTYDVLGDFKSDVGQRLKFITWNAFGKAVLLANKKENVQDLLAGAAWEHDGPRRAVVLIDEVDKAPRDFPNDILNEVENMRFRIPEVRNEPVSAPVDMHPVLIITSNSEKSLPDAFLRRCIYYNIPFPDPDQLEEIVRARIDYEEAAPETFLADALDFFKRLRHSSEAPLRKKPATAELLAWLVFLGKQIPDRTKPLASHGEVLAAGLSALVKTAEDQAAAERLLESWLKNKTSSK